MATSCNYRKFICVRFWIRATALCAGRQRDNASDGCIMFRRISAVVIILSGFTVECFFHLSRVGFLYLLLVQLVSKLSCEDVKSLHICCTCLAFLHCVFSNDLLGLGCCTCCLFNLFQRLAWGKPNIGHQVFSSSS